MSTLVRPEPQKIRPRAQRVVPPHLMMTREFNDEPKSREVFNVAAIAEPEMIYPRQPVIFPPASAEPQPKKLSSAAFFGFQPAPHIVRPIPMKVARPIPKSAMEKFYNEAYSQGLKVEHVHAATVLAQDWHRKWTQQDEEGHTMPENNEDYYQQALMRDAQTYLRTSQMLASPGKQESFVYNPLDRMTGAKNPSPEDLQEDLYSERKRLRLVAFDGSVSSLSPYSEDNSGDYPRPQESDEEEQNDMETPASKRRVRGVAEHPCTMVVETSAVSPDFLPIGMIRPMALRIQRPAAMDVSTAIKILTSRQNYVSDSVPADIIKELCTQHCTLSPLTLPSVSSSYRKVKPAAAEDEKTERDKTLGIPSIVSHVVVTDTGFNSPQIQASRLGVLHRLAATGGDVAKDLEFMSHLEVLKSFYKTTESFLSNDSDASEGTWLTLTKPTFFSNLGLNDAGDPMYTLGRMSFDMFSPTPLVCSLQGNFNIVHKVAASDRAAILNVPKPLQEEVEGGMTVLRTYDIITAFTIEPHLADYPTAPNKDVRRPIKGLMTTRGYILADPETPSRNSVWITGGRIEPNDDPIDQREWKRQFGKNPPKHTLGEKAKLLAVKLLMGATTPDHMDEDGSMEYEFHRPIGGHGLAYIDTIYVDESLRIVQGHRGTFFVFSKLSNGKAQ